MSDDPTLAGSPIDPTNGTDPTIVASTEPMNAAENGMAAPVPPPAPAKGRGGRIALGVVGIVGIVAGGAFAYTQLTGGEKANTPEQAVEGFYRAFERRDFIGMSKSLAPGERDVLLDSMVPMVGELSRLEILKKDFTLDKVEGYTAKVSNYKAKSKRIRSDLAAVTVTGGNLEATIDPKNLPFGDFIRKQFGKQLDEAESSTSTSPLRVGTESSPLIVQKIGKRWYISGNYSFAEAARRASDNPFAVPAKGSGVPAKGAATPEAAVSDFLQAGADLNLRRVIELLPPDEFAALHDYAGQFIVDAERSAADLQKQYTFKLSPKLATTSLGSDRRIVTIVDLPMTFKAVVNEQSIDVEYKNKTAKAVFSSDGKEDLRADYRGDCLTIVQEGETKKGCGRDGLAKLFTDLTGTPIDFTSIPATTGGLSGPCGKFAQPKLGFTVIKRDGLWYVSPFRTMLDTMTNSMKILERKDLDCIVKETKKVVDENQDDLFGTSSSSSSSSLPSLTDEAFPTDTSVPFDTSDTTPVTADPFADDTFASGPLVDTPACREMDAAQQAGEEPSLEVANQCMADAFGAAGDTAGFATADTTAGA